MIVSACETAQLPVHSETRPAVANGKGRVADRSQADQRRGADPLLLSYNSQDLLVALFRLAVVDAMAEPGDDDQDHRDSRLRRDAKSFIASDWAVELADMGLLPIAEIRRQLASSARRSGTWRPSKGLPQRPMAGERSR